jgi:hypothetical protein
LTFGTTVAINTPGSSATPDQTGPIAILHNIAGPDGTVLDRCGPPVDDAVHVNQITVLHTSSSAWFSSDAAE